MAKISKKTIRSAATAERRLARAANKAKRTGDSFQNFGLNLGIGTDNPLTQSTYGFNPITRNRTLLEWVHRGSWIGGMAINLVAEDMTRGGIDILCDAPPEDIDQIQQTLTNLGVWSGICDTVMASRLYGGALGVLMIDGQDYATPLNPDSIGKGQFRGVYPLDRWMVEPSLNDLVTEQGPSLGLPKFYRVTSDVPGMRMKIIHHSRCLRLDGIRLPYWQRVSENLWGISVIERLFDRMVAFDSSTTGAAQLAYKSYIRTYKMEGLRELLAAGGPAIEKVFEYVGLMRRFQSIEGVTVLDSRDEFVGDSSVNMTGLAEVLLQFGQQLSGALQIPLVRMFGQSPAGLNSTGESDLRTYYDGIKQQQNKDLLVPMTIIVRAAALSEGRKLPKDYKVDFRSLWQLSEEQKSEVAQRDAETIGGAEERGLISQATAMKELKTSSKVTGRFTNVTDEEIEDASDELAPRGQEAIDQDIESQKALSAPAPRSGLDKKDGDQRGTRDALPISEICGVQVGIETLRGGIRRGEGWEVVMPADYGYIRRAPSAEGATEWMDCFVGPDRINNPVAYIVDGYTPEGRFDEHKVMLGFADEREAMECYHRSYGDGRRAGGVTSMPIAMMRNWMMRGDVTRPLQPRNLRLAAGDLR